MALVRRIIAIALLSVVVFAAATGEASANRKRVPATASLEAVSADGIAGRIQTGPAPCRAARAVTVYMQNSASPSTFLKVGAAITSGDGTWSIRSWAYPGTYYAAVAGKTTRHYLCRGATSNSVTWWTSGSPD
jgi:hypothetical protein